MGALAKLRERLVRPGVQLSKGLRLLLLLELVRQVMQRRKSSFVSRRRSVP